jgi:hypothetical protein
MSTASAAGVTEFAPGQRAAPIRHWLRLFGSELRNVFLRPRNLAMLAVLAGAPVLLGVVMRVNTPAPGSDSEGAGVFVGEIAGNGVFLSLFALYVLLTVLLPLAVSVVSGDSVAGEAGLGTLRTLLTVPAGRTRLLATKYAMIVVFCFAATLLVAGLGLLMGAIFFPVGPVTLLSGDTVSLAAGLGRLALIGAWRDWLGAVDIHPARHRGDGCHSRSGDRQRDTGRRLAGGGHPSLPANSLLVLVRRAAADADRMVAGAARARVIRRLHRHLRRGCLDPDAARQHHLLTGRRSPGCGPSAGQRTIYSCGCCMRCQANGPKVVAVVL